MRLGHTRSIREYGGGEMGCMAAIVWLVLAMIFATGIVYLMEWVQQATSVM